MILVIMKKLYWPLQPHSGSMSWKKNQKSMNSAKFHPLRTFYQVRAIVSSWLISVKRFNSRRTISFQALGTATLIRTVPGTRFQTHCYRSTKHQIQSASANFLLYILNYTHKDSYNQFLRWNTHNYDCLHNSRDQALEPLSSAMKHAKLKMAVYWRRRQKGAQFWLKRNNHLLKLGNGLVEHTNTVTNQSKLTVWCCW